MCREKKTCMAIFLVIVLLFVSGSVTTGFWQERSSFHFSMEQNRAVQEEKTSPASEASLHIDEVVRTMVSEISAPAGALSMRSASLSVGRTEIQSCSYLLEAVAVAMTLLFVFLSLVSFLDTGGFYSKSYKILLYIHRKDGKKK